VRLAEDEGEREENRGILIVPFASAMSSRVMVITMRTLNFTCAEEVCDMINVIEKRNQMIKSDDKTEKYTEKCSEKVPEKMSEKVP
jgi:hypothetical protein